MRKLFLYLFLIGLAGISLFATYAFGFNNGVRLSGVAYNPTPQQLNQINEDRLFEAVNQWRIESGNKKYESSNILCGYANFRVKEIQKDWSHDIFETMQKTDNFSLLAENLAKDFTTENQVLNAWLKSTTHRKNLDNSFTHSCIRCENNYCVQLFGK